MTAIVVQAGASSGLSFNPVNDVAQLLAYHFMVNAFLAGTIVALSASAIGWFMVLRRQTFAGHTLAVIGFPGAAGAALVGLPLVTGYFGACIGGAVVIGLIPRSRSGGSRSSESAAIGTLQALALASGVLFVNLYHGFLNGVTALLFGSFLGITDTQVVVLAATCAVALSVLAFIWRPLLFSSVDADVAGAGGVPVRALSLAFLVLLGSAVAQASQITGSLLVFALLVMPCATAQRLTDRPLKSLGLGLCVGLLTTWGGLAAAYFSPYPVGFYLTSIGFACYLSALAVERHRRTHPVVAIARARNAR